MPTYDSISLSMPVDFSLGRSSAAVTDHCAVETSRLAPERAGVAGCRF
jgi:hypothetical protein